MNMPGFTADAALYRTSGHYQTLRHGGNSPARTDGPLRSAMISEEIEVFGCAPGFLQLGEGPNMVCLNPFDPFGTGGHDGGGVPGFGDGPGGGGGGGGGKGGGGRPQPERECRLPMLPGEAEGALWRSECAGKGLSSCCRARGRACLGECERISAPKSRQDCVNACNKARSVCLDRRNPPVVCSPA